MRRIHYTIPPLLLMAFGLSGCGGGSGDGMTATTATTTPAVTRATVGVPDPEPEPQDPSPLEVAEMDYNDEVEALAALADDASDADILAAEQDVLAAAQDWLAALKEANAAYSEVSQVEELVDSAQDDVDETQGRIDDAAELARRMAPIDPDAKEFRKAIMAAGHAMSPVGTGATNYFTVTGMLVDEATDAGVGEEDGFGKFAKSNKIAPEVMHEGWRSSVHERSKMTVGGPTFTTTDDVVVSDRVTVYSTQADPGNMYFAEYYGAERDGETTSESIGTDGAITLDDMQTGGHAKSSAFPMAGRSITYDGLGNNPPTPTGTGAIPGTYRGIAGVFACATGCIVTAGAAGNITTFGGTWTFTPDGDPATLVVRDVDPDTDYLTMGHWVRTTTTDGKPVYTVGVFTQTDIDALTTVSAAIGSATYVGPAAGLFSKREHAPGGDGAITMSGQFTADANLTADFGRDETDTGIVSGTIDNFMHGDTVIDSDWEVSMNRAAIVGADGGFAQDANATGTDGSLWDGNFYMAGDPTADGAATTMPPGYAAGTFENDFTNGEVIGAFGAELQKE